MKMSRMPVSVKSRNEVSSVALATGFSPRAASTDSAVPRMVPPTQKPSALSVFAPVISCTTLIALMASQELSEHESPGEVTVQVLLGRVRLRAGDDSWEGRRGDLLVVPQQPHSLESIEDSVVLMTVAKLP